MSDQKTDYLKEDPPLSGQDWTVISIVNPKDMVVKKNLHYANKFLVHDINKTLTAQAIQMCKYLNSQVTKKIADVLEKLENSVDEEDKRLYHILNKRYRDLTVDEDEYVDECRRRYELDDEEIMDRYTMYLAENRQQLDREFDEAYDHAASTRGIKVRGNFQRYEDAKARAKAVRDEVEPAIHAYVAPVGKWLPVDFDADEAQDQEYQLPQLNELMKKYHDNIHAKNQHYRERKADMEEQARTRNKKTTREALREKLRQRRNEKMKRELEAQQVKDPEQMMGEKWETEIKKTNKKKNKKKKKSKSKKSSSEAPVVEQ